MSSWRLWNYAHQNHQLPQACYYIIQDESIDYHLGGYDKTLEEARYHKFEPSYDLSGPSELALFKESDESKY